MDVQQEMPNKVNCDKYRLLELYSGIGGMRYALEAAGVSFETISAIDMNPVVNEIYRHNFGCSRHYQRNISSLTALELESMNIDIITMSPPCQPFTRVGLKKDIEDARSNSLLHILDILTQLQRKPPFIILENVQGFENSQAKDVLVQTLQQCNYRYQEFLLSPQDFGIPNSRLRYYLIAKFESHISQPDVLKMSTEIPNSSYQWKSHCQKCLLDVNNDFTKGCPLKHFIEENTSEYLKSYLVPDHILLKYWTVFDIVDENSCTCCCFTKAYSHYAQGTGSIFVPINDSSKVAEIFKIVTNTNDCNTQLELLRRLKLRYFTPKEIANIMCFPSSFNFPPNITLKQKYRSLGNSLNVFVVSCLIQSLLQNKIFMCLLTKQQQKVENEKKVYFSN